MERDMITMQDIFVFEKIGLDEDGRVRGRFRATGIRPKCSERLRRAAFSCRRRCSNTPRWLREVRQWVLFLRRFSLFSRIVFGAYWLLVVRPEQQESGALRRGGARASRAQKIAESGQGRESAQHGSACSIGALSRSGVSSLQPSSRSSRSGLQMSVGHWSCRVHLLRQSSTLVHRASLRVPSAFRRWCWRSWPPVLRIVYRPTQGDEAAGAVRRAVSGSH